MDGNFGANNFSHGYFIIRDKKCNEKDVLVTGFCETVTK